MTYCTDSYKMKTAHRTVVSSEGSARFKACFPQVGRSVPDKLSAQEKVMDLGADKTDLMEFGIYRKKLRKLSHLNCGPVIRQI